jgi:hypothetical protein
MTCILEINDADLTVYHDREAVFHSWRVAVVQGDNVQFGDDALALSRIHPRQTHQQYFARLNVDPLPGPGGTVRHHADLVYLHLQTLKPVIDEHGGEVLLAVPGVLSPDQLGVLLGVMQEAGIGVTGFVDSAVAAACGHARQRPRLPPRPDAAAYGAHRARDGRRRAKHGVQELPSAVSRACWTAG